MPLLRTFYGRLSAILLVLLLALGVALGALAVRSAFRLTEAADQELNRDLAHDLAPRFEPHLREGIDTVAIAEEIRGLTAVNRRIDVYLLGPDGVIKGSFVQPGQALQLARVDVGPLDRLMGGAGDLPILGTDPLDPAAPKPFSVAPVAIMGDPACYLYIVLGGERYASVLAMLAESHLLRGALVGLALVVLGAALVGLLLFAFVTRRLRQMTAVVGAFEGGRLDRRVPDGTSDEVGQLGAAFNRMADAIAVHVAELERADRLRQEFVEDVSHDLRNPLASIRGYLETLLLKGSALAPAERERHVEVALANVDRLSELVEGLFELSKWGAQPLTPRPEPFSLAELIHDVVVHFQPAATERGVELVARMSPSLPLVHADVGMVDRVIANLVENALRHTPAGGRVEVVPWHEGDHVGVRVSDTGEGIAPEDLPHIFERFYRSPRSRHASDGSGLGLFIAQKVLEAHGRAIHVESALGVGTTFRFDLPVWAGAGRPSLLTASHAREPVR